MKDTIKDTKVVLLKETQGQQQERIKFDTIFSESKNTMKIHPGVILHQAFQRF